MCQTTAVANVLKDVDCKTKHETCCESPKKLCQSCNSNPNSGQSVEQRWYPSGYTATQSWGPLYQPQAACRSHQWISVCATQGLDVLDIGQWLPFCQDCNSNADRNWQKCCACIAWSVQAMHQADMHASTVQEEQRHLPKPEVEHDTAKTHWHFECQANHQLQSAKYAAGNSSSHCTPNRRWENLVWSLLQWQSSDRYQDIRTMCSDERHAWRVPHWLVHPQSLVHVVALAEADGQHPGLHVVESVPKDGASQGQCQKRAVLKGNGRHFGHLQKWWHRRVAWPQQSWYSISASRLQKWSAGPCNLQTGLWACSQWPMATAVCGQAHGTAWQGSPTTWCRACWLHKLWYPLASLLLSIWNLP